MGNKTIWILNHYAVTPEMPGGTRHFDFASELVNRGYHVTIFAASFHHQKLKELKLENEENYKCEDYEGVKFIWIKTFPYKTNNWRRFINMLSYMYRVCVVAKFLVKHREIDKPDVIIGSSVHLFSVLSAYYLSRYYNAKFIMEIRDLWPQTLIDLGKMSKIHPVVLLFGILERFLYKKAKKIITLMPMADKYLFSLGIAKDKIVYIPNGVNLKKFSSTIKNTSNDGYFKIFYVGGHSQTDNLYVLLEVAKNIKEMNLPIRFILVGDGMEKQKLVEFAKEKELEDTVSFRQHVAKSEVPKILAEADILYLSMKVSDIYKYGMGFNKLFEYMASAKPIILYGNPENNPIEKSGAGVVVNTAEKVVNAIINFYHMSPELRFEIGKRGQIYVEKYHNIPVLVDKLENVIKEIQLC